MSASVPPPPPPSFPRALDRADPTEAGRGRRRAAPRSSHAGWTVVRERPKAVAILESQAATRDQELVPIRHGRMAASEFAFFRGTAAVMAADLATTPASGILVQACGDAHLLNFGVYATPERNLVFDLNDFDEAHPAVFEWDVKRLAASLHVAGREHGFSDAHCRAATRAAARSYRQHVLAFATQGYLDVWYSRIDIAEVMPLLDPHRGARALERLRRRTNIGALDRLCETVQGRPHIKDAPPIVEHPHGPPGEAFLEASVADYRESLLPYRQELLSLYRPLDLARKVVGVGSVGLQAWVMLLEGRDQRDPLVLQVKEAEGSALAPFNPPAVAEHHGKRVVFGQRVLQAAPDLFLGWFTGATDGRHYYVRQLGDMKGAVAVEKLSRAGLTTYGEVCGRALARGHARSGDAAVIAGYLGSSDVFDRAIEQFAASYAEQNAADYRTFRDAVHAGRFEARMGV